MLLIRKFHILKLNRTINAAIDVKRTELVLDCLEHNCISNRSIYFGSVAYYTRIPHQYFNAIAIECQYAISVES